jgi:hypothetical protein
VGIVPSVDNFGTTGEKPTHPELLDYLSKRLLDSDGSSKSLLRLMVESRTYRQTCSSIHSDVDPGNRLLSGMRIRRLDAETIRDTMLVASGELQSTVGGTTIQEGTVTDYGYKDQSMRRSLYVPVLRNALPDFQMVFDFPDPSLVTGERTSSTIAPQALYLMNHPFVQERAQETARRILAENASLEDQLRWVFERILSRPPTEGETELMREVLRSAPDPSVGWRQVVQLLFESIDFRFYR